MSGPRRLEGKIVIITGGASGIGAEAVKLFTEHGAKVVIVDLQDKLGENAVASIGEDKASYYHCDITDETEVENAVKFTVKKHGKVDVLFSNAGIVEPIFEKRSMVDLNLEQMDRIMAVNVRGAAAFIKHAARAMVANATRGSIVCTTSIAAEIAGPGAHGYTASKHGLLGLIRSGCGELGEHGIRINGVAPYAVATKMNGDGVITAKVVETLSTAFGVLKGIPLKTSHVAETALFLASDESAYISGQNLAVDGGYSVVKPIPKYLLFLNSLKASVDGFLDRFKIA